MSFLWLPNCGTPSTIQKMWRTPAGPVWPTWVCPTWTFTSCTGPWLFSEWHLGEHPPQNECMYENSLMMFQERERADASKRRWNHLLLWHALQGHLESHGGPGGEGSCEGYRIVQLQCQADGWNHARGKTQTCGEPGGTISLKFISHSRKRT